LLDGYTIKSSSLKHLCPLLKTFSLIPRVIGFNLLRVLVLINSMNIIGSIFVIELK
jgi:hypothetical protein